MGYCLTRSAQLCDKIAELDEGIFQRLQLLQLAADMHRHTAQVHPRQTGQTGIDPRRTVNRHTKLVLGLAG